MARKTIFGLNKYQKVFFLPAVVSFFVGCLSAWLSLMYFLLDDYKGYEDLGFVRIVIPVFLVLLLVILVGVVWWLGKLTGNVVGAHERLIREMDEIIEGNRKELLHVRPQDEMLGEIAKRFNLLINKKA